MSLLESRARRESTLWHNNTVLVQLLGLSPVLAISSSAVDGLALGLATLIVLLLSCATASIYRSRISQTWRLVWFLCIMAFFTSLVDLILQWQYFTLSRRLGIYVPLICCNSAILIRMEVFARKNKPGDVLRDAAITGAGFLSIIMTLAIGRELLATGVVFKDMDLLIPVLSGEGLQMPGYMITDDLDFITLAPGALIGLGLLIAVKNSIDSMQRRNKISQDHPVKPAVRARVTNRS
jgi:electron transport complex protein RnfE